MVNVNGPASGTVLGLPSFRIAEHGSKKGVSVVEVLLNGHVCAVIYPDDDASMKIISAHFAGELTTGDDFPDGVRMDNADVDSSYIPVVNIRFDPRQYHLEAGCIVRHE